MSESVTILLKAHQDGDPGALNELANVLYPDLKALARRRSKNSAGIGATTLVQETFSKLLADRRLRAEDRKEFFALAATVMRQIIIDEIRYVTAGKRDGKKVTFADTIIADDSHKKAEFLLEIDEVLTIVASEDPRLVKVFECRYFAGFTTSETAEAMDTSARSVERLWSQAKVRVGELMGSQQP